jgi:hypothetical protein
MEMAYASISDLQGYLPGWSVVTGSAHETRINNILTSTSDVIDSFVRNSGYDIETTPISAIAHPKSWSILRDLNAVGAIGRLAGEDLQGEEVNLQFFRDTFNLGLKNIQQLPEYLYDAPKTTDVIEDDMSQMVRGYETSNTDEERTPFFQIRKEW